jgi:glucose dehydrogenase
MAPLPLPQEVSLTVRSRLAWRVVLAALIAVPAVRSAQLRGGENGQRRYLGGDARAHRFSPLTQIDASNFADLEAAWIYSGSEPYRCTEYGNLYG